MRRTIGSVAAAVAIIAVSFVTAGCLVKDTTNTLVLEPDGSVRWVVLEQNVHSDGENAEDIRKEESEYLAAVRTEQNQAAVAFRALGGDDVHSRLVDEKWPVSASTEARFGDIATVWQRCLDGVGISGESVLTRGSNRTTWTLTIDSTRKIDVAESDVKRALESLLSDDEGVSIFLRQGRFVEAVGFTLKDDGHVAKLDDLDKHDWDKEPKFALSLTWVSGD